MKQQYRTYVRFIFFFMLSCACVGALTKGSTSLLSLEDHVIFPAADDNNLMQGFAWFKEGFTLEDATTSCSFGAAFPVSGDINLRGGYLTLLSDLSIVGLSTVNSWGSCLGNSHILDLSSSITALTFDSYKLAPDKHTDVLEDVTIQAHTNITLSGKVKLRGTCEIAGNGGALILGDDADIALDSQARLVLRDVKVKNVSGTKLRCLDDSGQIVLDNVVWLQDGNYSFTHGSFAFANAVKFLLPYTFSYESHQTSTIRHGSICYWKGGITLSCARSSSNGAEPFYFSGPSSVFAFDNAHWHIPSSGMQVTKGKVLVQGELSIDADATSTTQGLHLGNGVSDDDPIIELHRNGHIIFNRGPVIFDSTKRKAIESHSRVAKISRKDDNVSVFKHDIEFANMHYFRSPHSVSIAEQAIQIFATDITAQMSNGGECVITATCPSTTVCSLSGNGLLSITKGVYPLVLTIHNSDNRIEGAGIISGPVLFGDSSAEIQSNFSGIFSGNMSLNGGKLALLHDFVFSGDGGIASAGIVDIDSHALSMSPKVHESLSDISWLSQSGRIVLHSSFALSHTWTVSGSCTIEGNGNTLTFGDKGAIVIDRNSDLTLKNIRLENIAEQAISCLDDSATLVLDSVQWLQSGDYKFSNGSFRCRNNINFGGAHSFIYDSLQTSTLEAGSHWHCYDGMHLAIGRHQDASCEPLELTDGTSELSFAHAMLSIRDGGLCFHRGRLAFDREVVVSFASTSTMNGLELGDGVSSDVEIEFYPGSSVVFGAGHFIYNVPQPTAVTSRSSSSRLIRKAGNVVHVKKDLSLSNITIETDPDTAITFEQGASLFYDNATVSDPDYSFNIVGKRYNAFTHLLSNGGDIFLSKGVQPAVILASGKANKIHGTGNIGQVVSLVDNTSELFFSLEGSMLDDVHLNSGLIVLTGDLSFAGDAAIVGPGNVDLHKHTLLLGNKDKNYHGDLFWDADNGVIALRSKISLSHTWTLSGLVVVNGRGNTLSLANGGDLVIDSQATVVLKNIRIESVQNNNIRCVDDTARIIVQDARWDLANNFDFSHGTLEIRKLFDIHGSATFYLKTAQPITIGTDATWRFYEGPTLSYAPRVAQKDLITFADKSSLLSLYNASIHATTTGMHLTRGRLKVKGNCLVKSDARNLFEGIWFGDGVQADNDIDIDIFPESTLAIDGAYVVYKNVDE